ncbi:MAG: RNA-processing protein [Zestosphaera tikiterensis]|uniref:RNA-processing protein n=1 Tax=Zestosphaera tikiterensis TaxID=1973259 RepID=A0A2R7Y6W8_9CREN|nr:MAG: RNA-processing protein [Zestosphaera tikiterensis]
MDMNELNSRSQSTTKVYLKVRPERLGVLIGEGGKTLKQLELRTRTRITVDSVNCSLVIEPATPEVTADMLLKASDFVKAIDAGFSPDKAERVLEEDQILVIIDLKEIVGNSPNHLQRVKGRIIGEEGRVKTNIEQATDTYISIYDDIVAIIGDYDNAYLAREAIEMIIMGREHSTVYKYLDKRVRELKRRKATEFWIRKP